MNKTERAIYELFKPYFAKYPELESLQFDILKDSVGKLIVCDVMGSVTINGMLEGDYEDNQVVGDLGEIENAIVLLKKFEKEEKQQFLEDCIRYLESKYGGLFGKIRNTPELKMVDAIYYPNTRMLTLVIQDNLSEFSHIDPANWGYLDSLTMVVNKSECYCENGKLPTPRGILWKDGVPVRHLTVEEQNEKLKETGARILTDAELNEYLKSAGMRTRPEV